MCRLLRILKKLPTILKQELETKQKYLKEENKDNKFEIASKNKNKKVE